MARLNKICIAVILLLTLGSITTRAQTLRHEAHAWWKPPTADAFRIIQLRVDVPTAPVSGILSLQVPVTIPALEGLTDEPTVSFLFTRIDEEASGFQFVNWTPTLNQREVVTTMFVDTSALTEGWHRLEVWAGVDDTESQRRLVSLAASFEVGSGSASDVGVPQGPKASSFLDDQLTDPVRSFVETEISSAIPTPVPLSWQPTLSSHGTIGEGEPEEFAPTLFVSFDDAPDTGEHTNIQVNEWPAPPTDFTIPLQPPDGASWMYTRATLHAPANSLGAVLIVGVDTGTGTSDPPDDPESPDPPGGTDPSDTTLITGQWHVAPGGAGNGAPGAPLGSIQQALDLAQPGDTVLVAPGTYLENLITRRNGTAEQKITLESTDGRGSVEVIDASGSNVLEVLHQHYLVIGFVFDGNYAETDTILIEDNADFLEFIDNAVQRSGRDCLDIRGPEGVIFERSSVHSCV